MPHLLSRSSAWWLSAAVTFAVACAGRSSDPNSPSPSPATAPSTATPTTTATALSTPPASGSPPVGPSPPPNTATVETAPAELDRALQAAEQVLGAPNARACREEGDCLRPFPGAEATAAAGIVRVQLRRADGGGAVVVMGRTVGGQWALWLAAQEAQPQVVELPGEARVCGPGESVQLYRTPGGAAAGSLARDQTVEAQEFLLMEPGSLDAPGEGWYRLAGPGGWVRAEDIAVGDCGTDGRGDGVG